MKRGVLFVVIMAVSLFLFSCKSSEVVPAENVVVTDNDKEGKPAGSEAGTQESVPGEVHPDESVTDKDKENKEDKSGDKTAPDKDNAGTEEETVENADKAATASVKEEGEPEAAVSVSKKSADDRGFIGWIDMGIKNPTESKGIVKIETNSKLGTFCISALDKKDKSYPVLSTFNEFSNSGFSLKVGNEVYRLMSGRNIRTISEKVDSGVKVKYSLKDRATVSLEMIAVAADNKSSPDTVKVTVDVRNTGDKNERFALKGIFDTVLGENSTHHFYSSRNKPVENAFVSKQLSGDKWFLSKNDKASMEIILFGENVTTPACVALANYTVLESAKWIPDISGYVTFDTVLSYNNSAIGVYWPEVSLGEGKSYTTTFYISLALNGNIPNGHKYLCDKEVSVTEETVSSGASESSNKAGKKDISPENKEGADMSNSKDGESNTNKKTSPDESGKGGADKGSLLDELVEPEVEPDNNNIEFNVKNISKDHLTQEYIQSLIGRIAELEASGSSVNRSEILQLNAELDAILSIIR